MAHLSDRINVAKDGAFPEILLSTQVLLDHDFYDNGCHGGDAFMAMKWIKENGVQEEACSQYRAQGHELPKPDVQPVCKDCKGGNCFVPQKYNTFTISHYGALPPGDVEAMMTEIYARGPIFCSVDAGPMENITFGFTGVLSTNNFGETDHVISVVGWGTDEESGKDYWIVKNSWGEYFADNGFIKVERGKNTLWIEEFCGYGVPKDTWSDMKKPTDGSEDLGNSNNIDIEDAYYTIKSSQDDTSEELTIENLGVVSKEIDEKLEKKLTKEFEEKLPDKLKQEGYQNSEYLETKESESKKTGDIKQEAVSWKPVVTNPIPSDYMQVSELPERFWWGNVNGINYLSWVLNQHIPQDCGSSYAFSTLGALSDRINISTKNLRRTSLSVQNLLNCGIGSCEEGGSLGGVYEFANQNGVSEYGCFNYQAKSPPADKRTCSDLDQCVNCWGTADKFKCWGVQQYIKWHAKEYGTVSGSENMKKEIFARGPIACTMKVSDRFWWGYQGGIWREKLDSTSRVEHGVSVVGWGKTVKDGEFWILRNSWGTYWGESGYFRLGLNDTENNLGIEENCYWAVPQAKTVNPSIITYINRP